jgi:hypothetical protein
MDEDRKTFYVGTEVDPATGQAGAPVLYPGKGLTTGTGSRDILGCILIWYGLCAVLGGNR